MVRSVQIKTPSKLSVKQRITMLRRILCTTQRSPVQSPHRTSALGIRRYVSRISSVRLTLSHVINSRSLKHTICWRTSAKEAPSFWTATGIKMRCGIIALWKFRKILSRKKQNFTLLTVYTLRKKQVWVTVSTSLCRQLSLKYSVFCLKPKRCSWLKNSLKNLTERKVLRLFKRILKLLIWRLKALSW